MKKLFLVALFLFGALFADETSPSQIPCIQGVILVGCESALLRENISKHRGVCFHDIDIPGNFETLRSCLCDALIGKELCRERILEAEEMILCFYKENHHPLVLVFTPEQKVEDGVFQIVVLESRIGQICFTGNNWFSDDLIGKNICLNEGCLYDEDRIQKDLIWLNRNPFRNTRLILKPGCEEGTTDIDICTQDCFPYRFFVGSDNTGFRTTGRERLFAGVTLANLFRCDQLLNYQYTTSTDFGKFYAHTGQYKIPLPWHNLIDFYGGYSSIRALMPFEGMSSQGRAWQASMRYTIPLTPIGCYCHEVKWGVDYKQSDVNLVFDAIPILGNRTVISQLVLGYSGSYEDSFADVSFEGNLFISPGDIFPNQSRSDYESLRPFARANYTYFRFTAIPIFHLPACFDGVIKTEFQVANRNLLSSEQFGLGGLFTVRGYDERILNTDNAFLISGEIRTPNCPFVTRRYCKNMRELFQFLAFVDYGFGTNHKPLPGEQNFRYLLSTGIGARYYLGYHVNVQFNWGYPIHKDIGNGVRQRDAQFNYSAIVSF